MLGKQRKLCVVELRCNEEFVDSRYKAV